MSSRPPRATPRYSSTKVRLTLCRYHPVSASTLEPWAEVLLGSFVIVQNHYTLNEAALTRLYTPQLEVRRLPVLFASE